MPTYSKNRAKLTATVVDRTEPNPERDVLVWDTVQQGLALKVTPKGARVFLCFYRTANGQQRKPKLGEWPTLSVEEARKLAAAWRGDAASGGDVSGARQRARQGESLGDLWPRYLEHARGRWKPRTEAENVRLWEKDLGPALGRCRLADLNRREVERAHARLGVERGHFAANRNLALLRAMLNVADGWGLLDGPNPTKGVKPFPEPARERYLEPGEIRRLLDAIAVEEALGREGAASRKRKVEGSPRARGTGRGGRGLTEQESRGITTFQAGLFRVLLLTGCRLREVLDAEWSWVDWDRAILALPDAKAGARAVLLNAEAIAELERLREAGTRGRWIVEGATPGERLVNPSKAWRRVIKRARLEGLRLHDVRHAWASVAVGGGAGLPLIGKALGHRTPATTARYAHAPTDPLRKLVESVGATIVGKNPARKVKRSKGKPKANAGGPARGGES